MAKLVIAVAEVILSRESVAEAIWEELLVTIGARTTGTVNVDLWLSRPDCENKPDEPKSPLFLAE